MKYTIDSKQSNCTLKKHLQNRNHCIQILKGILSFHKNIKLVSKLKNFLNFSKSILLFKKYYWLFLKFLLNLS